MPGENALSSESSTPLSLSTFHSDARRYWKILQEKEIALLDAYNVFAGKQDIWPDQCRRITALVDLLSEPVQQFCKLLANSALIPESVVPHRYLLLATLQHMDEQIKALLPLILTFRKLCQKSSRQNTKLRFVIQRKLELLVRDCVDSLQYVHELSDKARFEEKKIKQFLVVQQKLESPQEIRLYEYEKDGRGSSESGRRMPNGILRRHYSL